MPRLPRLQFEGALYHVFSRGNRRERIYETDSDYAMFEKIMIEAMNWSGVQLYAWCLMPNHFHLLLETPEGNLSEFMQRLATRYAKYFNWAHKKVGHVFQSRYGARLCDKESYFTELVRYIHLNPYRTKGKALAALGSWMALALFVRTYKLHMQGKRVSVHLTTREWSHQTLLWMTRWRRPRWIAKEPDGKRLHSSKS